MCPAKLSISTGERGNGHWGANQEPLPHEKSSRSVFLRVAPLLWLLGKFRLDAITCKEA